MGDPTSTISSSSSSLREEDDQMCNCNPSSSSVTHTDHPPVPPDTSEGVCSDTQTHEPLPVPLREHSEPSHTHTHPHPHRVRFLGVSYAPPSFSTEDEEEEVEEDASVFSSCPTSAADGLESNSTSAIYDEEESVVSSSCPFHLPVGRVAHNDLHDHLHAMPSRFDSTASFYSQHGTPQVRRLKDLPVGRFAFIVLDVCLLSMNGGFMNGVAVAGVFRVAVTHITGTTTLTGLTLADSSFHRGQYGVLFLLSIIGVYLFGIRAFLAGIILGERRKTWRGRQASVLALEAVSIWLAVCLLEYDLSRDISLLLIALASSLQNATTSTLDIMTIKTTNMTGALVDLGLALGQIIREGSSLHLWKLALRFPHFFSFFIGTILGGLAFREFQHNSYIFSAVFITASSVGSFVLMCMYPHRHALSTKGPSLTSPNEMLSSPSTDSLHHSYSNFDLSSTCSFDFSTSSLPKSILVHSHSCKKSLNESHSDASYFSSASFEFDDANHETFSSALENAVSSCSRLKESSSADCFREILFLSNEDIGRVIRRVFQVDDGCKESNV